MLRSREMAKVDPGTQFFFFISKDDQKINFSGDSLFVYCLHLTSNERVSERVLSLTGEQMKNV